MSWGEIKKAINTDFSEPLNYANWANSIANFGDDSFVVKDYDKLVELGTNSANARNESGLEIYLLEGFIQSGQHIGEYFKRVIPSTDTVFDTLATIQDVANSSEAMDILWFSDNGKKAISYSETAKTETGIGIYRTMGVEIDLANSNPETSVTYIGDATSLTPGSIDWDYFFGHRPCMFQNGAFVGYLDRDDFTKYEDGTPADITSGAEGDVMIEFPRRALSISTVGDILTIEMTDIPDADQTFPRFEYNAHKRGVADKDYFYLGAYKGHNLSSALRSLSGKAPTANQTISQFRTLAQANGSGYEQSGFYQLTYRQCMYVLKYKNLDSQTAVGQGYVNGASAINTGGTEDLGMDYGGTNTEHMKLFGLEDYWGNVWEWIDGLVSTSTRNILTSSDNFNNSGSGYVDNGQGATSNLNNYMSKPQGGVKTGFVVKEVSGSSTTYFCDSADLYASSVARFGGAWPNASDAGAFQLAVYYSASDSNAGIASRLMYL